MSKDKSPPTWPGKPRADHSAAPRGESAPRRPRDDWRPRESSPSGASPYRLPQPFAKPAGENERSPKPGSSRRAPESHAERAPRGETRRGDGRSARGDAPSGRPFDSAPRQDRREDRRGDSSHRRDAAPDPQRRTRAPESRDFGRVAATTQSPYGQRPRPDRTASSPWQGASASAEVAQKARAAHPASSESLPMASDVTWTPRQEQKIYGLNAVRAAFAARPQSLRKVYLLESRLGDLRELLAHCVRERLGYRVVPADDMDRLCASQHHEGVCVLMTPPELPTLQELLAAHLDEPAQRLIWLDGVGNPHNLGAVLRSAAHFGATAVLLPEDSTLGLSGAAVRVAEGGAEVVPLLRVANTDEAVAMLRDAGFVLCATLPRDAVDLYAEALPDRAVFVFGAEASGMRKDTLHHCERRLQIPGSGKVESLNIANAVGVVLAEHWRQTMG